MATATDRDVRGSQLGLLERLPWRKIILVVLSALILLVVVVGSVKTLTLPADERYTSTRGRTSSPSAWRRARSSR